MLHKIFNKNGQSSIELMVISMIVLVLVIGMIKTTVQINKENSTVSIIKMHLLSGLNEQDEFYFIEDIVPENIENGQSTADIKIKIGPGPWPVPDAAEIDAFVTEGKNAVINKGIYDSIGTTYDTGT